MFEYLGGLPERRLELGPVFGNDGHGGHASAAPNVGDGKQLRDVTLTQVEREILSQ